MIFFIVSNTVEKFKNLNKCVLFSTSSANFDLEIS